MTKRVNMTIDNMVAPLGILTKSCRLLLGSGGAEHAGGVQRNLSVISVCGLDGPGSQRACAAGGRWVLVHFC